MLIDQSVAVLIDGNNIEMSIKNMLKSSSFILNYKTFIPKIINGRKLNRLIYFREGVTISDKFSKMLDADFKGSVRPCHKSADIPLTITAIQLAQKVDTIIILSGDADYIDLVKHLKHMGVRVEMASVDFSASNHLIDITDSYHEITKDDCFHLKAK